VLAKVIKLTIVMVPFQPMNMGGSSCILTSRGIAGKQAIVNVKTITMTCV